METIILKRAWSYRTPQKTIDYFAGTHEVTAEIAKHARAERVLAESEGDQSDAGLGPLDQSVPDLEAYLQTVTDAAEIDRLIRAEEAGKTRTTALAALRARKEQLEA